MKNKIDAKTKYVLAGFALLVTAFCLLAVMGMRGTEVVSHSSDSKIATKAVYCQSNKTTNTFLLTNSPVNATHEIKIPSNDSNTFISYTYTGNYDTHENALNEEATSHAKFNTLLQESGIDAKDLYPTFSVVDSSLIINYTLSKKLLNESTAKLLLLQQEDLSIFLNGEREQVNNLYTKKGFTCKNIN